jgi:hypothetical protein
MLRANSIHSHAKLCPHKIPAACSAYNPKQPHVRLLISVGLSAAPAGQCWQLARGIPRHMPAPVDYPSRTPAPPLSDSTSRKVVAHACMHLERRFACKTISAQFWRKFRKTGRRVVSSALLYLYNGHISLVEASSYIRPPLAAS